jgi:hypothetical protein
VACTDKDSQTCVHFAHSIIRTLTITGIMFSDLEGNQSSDTREFKYNRYASGFSLKS